MNAALFQAVAVIPLLLVLVGYTVTHPVRKTVHDYLVAVLVAMMVWCLAMGLAFSDLDPPVRMAAVMVANLGAAVLTPLCLLTIGNYARVEMVESGRIHGLIWPPSIFFCVAMATDPWHHWVYRDVAGFLALRSPQEWGGPLFWAFTGWSFIATFASVGIILSGYARARTGDERKRLMLILGAISAPILCHAAFVGSWLPLDYPLTPASFAVTGLMLVAGIQRYELLEGQPVVRRDVIEHLRDGLLVARADGTVVDANPLALEMLGAEADDIIGASLEEASVRLTRDALHVKNAPSADAEHGHDLVVETADGRTLELHPVTIGDEEGDVDGRALMIRDRTAERRNERILHQRQKLESVGILAAGVAHEVNNPLAYVRSNLAHLNVVAAELEKDRDPGTALAELREVLEESQTGLDRIGRIVDRLLRFSRPSEGRCPLDVNELVEEAIRFASLHRCDRVRVESDFDESLPSIDGSADRLLQAVLNLLLNARQALEAVDEPHISVVTRLDREDDGRWLVIEVADNGPGVPPAARERIFDPFFTTRSPGEGTGLGLSIAFDIVRDHDGTLELQSPTGRGAAFVIRLPVG